MLQDWSIILTVRPPTGPVRWNVIHMLVNRQDHGKEHENDRKNELEESHQIKHWLLDHPELDAPPKFKFKMIASFSDPLTRQLSEAVRIEKRGEHIRNSKAEFNRCRVPRLQIDMEGWRAGKEREKKDKEEREKNKLGLSCAKLSLSWG